MARLSKMDLQVVDLFLSRTVSGSVKKTVVPRGDLVAGLPIGPQIRAHEKRLARTITGGQHRIPPPAVGGSTSTLSRQQRDVSIPKTKLRNAFDAIDANGDGVLDETELRELGEALGVALDVRGLVQQMDHDGDGRVSFCEFARWLERDAHTKGDDEGEASSTGASDSETLSRPRNPYLPFGSTQTAQDPTLVQPAAATVLGDDLTRSVMDVRTGLGRDRRGFTKVQLSADERRDAQRRASEVLAARAPPQQLSSTSLQYQLARCRVKRDAAHKCERDSAAI
eukprot:SAG11_NODE_1967_length_3986_cov_19.956522_2_plen_282_part_00